MSTILVTGAATGFGNVTARTLAHAGHTVYASMRNTQSRNAPRVDEIRAYAAEHGAPQVPPPFLGPYVAAEAAMDGLAAVTAYEIARVVDLPVGERPMRTVVDPIDDGAGAVIDVMVERRTEFMGRLGLEQMLHPAAAGSAAR